MAVSQEQLQVQEQTQQEDLTVLSEGHEQEMVQGCCTSASSVRIR